MYIYIYIYIYILYICVYVYIYIYISKVLGAPPLSLTQGSQKPESELIIIAINKNSY